MDILMIGATDVVGSRIVNEAVERGHRVTALVVHEGAALPRGVETVRSDAVSDQDVARHARGKDAVVVAVAGDEEGDSPTDDVVETVSQGVRLAGGDVRLFVVGGPGSGDEALEVLEPREELNWTYLSPAAEIAPGERTGTYRVGGEEPFADEGGRGRISAEDYAVAVVDELEKPKHLGRRFSVAY